MATSFGQRLKAARLMAGLSMDALVAAMNHGISKQAISKYENNKMLPDSRILIALGKALSVQPDFFFAQVELSLDAVNFRRKASLGIKAVDSLKAKVKDELERYLELESFLSNELTAAPKPEPIPVAKLEDIEQAAVRLRLDWGIGVEGPVAYIVDLFEEHGIKVLELEGPQGFDGLSGFIDKHPFIVLNKQAPADRKRLTGLHEFAHLYLTYPASLGEKEQEKLCHAFGGAFLMPKEILIRELGAKRSNISYYELNSLKSQYGISMQAIMYRAKQYNIITDYAYEAFSKDLSIRGWRKNEPGDYPIQESPLRFKQLLHRALSEELISSSKAAYLAKLSITELRAERSLSDATTNS
jgi:Zn-dependent peptidase ImmA (M78 family)/DNA-binding XRE family transcriptional regulator